MTLPPLISFSGFDGSWPQYEEEIYQVFRTSISLARLGFSGKPVFINRDLVDGREKTFWHLTSEGPIEEERTPCLRRCARMPWVRCIFDHCHTNCGLVGWTSYRKGKKNVVLSLPDFTYAVIIGDRGPKAYLLSAYATSRDHEQERFRRQYEAALKAGDVLALC